MKIEQQFLALKAIIRCQEKVLILQESSHQERTHTGRWGFPGGRIRVGENPFAGLRREVKEETGLAISLGQPFAVSEWCPVIMGIPTQIVAVFILCTSTDDTVALSEEHDQYQWIEPRLKQAHEMMPEEKAVFEQYLQTAYNTKT